MDQVKAKINTRLGTYKAFKESGELVKINGYTRQLIRDLWPHCSKVDVLDFEIHEYATLNPFTTYASSTGYVNIKLHIHLPQPVKVTLCASKEFSRNFYEGETERERWQYWSNGLIVLKEEDVNLKVADRPLLIKAQWENETHGIEKWFEWISFETAVVVIGAISHQGLGYLQNQDNGIVKYSWERRPTIRPYRSCPPPEIENVNWEREGF